MHWAAMVRPTEQGGQEQRSESDFLMPAPEWLDTAINVRFKQLLSFD